MTKNNTRNMSQPSSRHSESRTWTEAGPDTVSLSNIESVDLPIQYNNWSATGILFSAPIESLRTNLPGQLSPLHITPRTGLVAMISVEYRDVVEIGPYNEFVVMIPVRESTNEVKTGTRVGDDILAGVQFGLDRLMGTDEPSAGIGNFIHYMPVTTEEACELGTKGWSYPKEITDIGIEQSTRTQRTRVSIDDKLLISLKSRLLRQESLHQSGVTYTYSERNGGLIRAPIKFSGRFAVRPLDPRASFTLGEHPRADTIRQLEIGSRPIAQLYAGNVRSSLHPAEEMR